MEEIGTTRTEEVMAPGGPSPGGRSSPCQSTNRSPSQTATSCHTPLTSLTNRSRVKPNASVRRSTPSRALNATAGSRRYARQADSKSRYGDQSGNTAGNSGGPYAETLTRPAPPPSAAPTQAGPRPRDALPGRPALPGWAGDAAAGRSPPERAGGCTPGTPRARSSGARGAPPTPPGASPARASPRPAAR